ncbi:MAG: hypothetical protein J3Q66DRAFT_380032 [Benniella sp.]|nr:MAG: hypothetical protein J3Q66DRAFT_380032 [Benniella sp.]
MHYAGFSLATAMAAVSALLLTSLSTTTEAVTPCNPETCVHPACVCPSMKPPKGMDPKMAPQFFTLAFDDTVQAPTVPVARALMSSHINPNGCPIKAPWFAQTIYSDYSLIQQWYAAGNEVADHTMTHVAIPPAEEIVGNRKAINAFSGVPFSNLNGFQTTFQILGQEKFLYSSTNAVPSDAYWPYTLDNGLHNDCWNGICDKGIPTPGMWEIPMHAIMDNKVPTLAHAMDVHLDGFSSEVPIWLRENFNRHYNGDRAPFGLPSPSSSSKPDVWFFTNQQLIEWMKNPVPASQLADQPYMNCTLPAIGKEICNGLDDMKSGTTDKSVLETCSFVEGPWSTCYGCPKSMPSPSDPVPERVVATGQSGYRTPVSTTCAMEWWDPIEAKCLCQSTNCTFADTAIPTNTKDPNGSSGSSDPSSKSSASGKHWIKDAWLVTSMGLVIATVAGAQLF